MLLGRRWFGGGFGMGRGLGMGRGMGFGRGRGYAWSWYGQGIPYRRYPYRGYGFYHPYRGAYGADYPYMPGINR